ncbi:MAG TPA: hypothetical protein VHG11_02490, partial [Pseudorhizobium sp.]|nr:hypothetical protein [Pseudorhizobium sp.]
MKKSVVATALLLLLQGPAIADHSMLCKSLSRRLAAVPEVIGSSSEVRRYAEALRDQEVTIRSLRTELRRSGCGAGSIVSYGRSEDICRQIADALRQAEVDRERIRAQRGAALSIIRPNGERNAILAALQENGCGHSAVAPQPVAVVPELPERQP